MLAISLAVLSNLNPGLDDTTACALVLAILLASYLFFERHLRLQRMTSHATRDEEALDKANDEPDLRTLAEKRVQTTLAYVQGLRRRIRV